MVHLSLTLCCETAHLHKKNNKKKKQKFVGSFFFFRFFQQEPAGTFLFVPHRTPLPLAPRPTHSLSFFFLSGSNQKPCFVCLYTKTNHMCKHGCSQIKKQTMKKYRELLAYNRSDQVWESTDQYSDVIIRKKTRETVNDRTSICHTTSKKRRKKK